MLFRSFKKVAGAKVVLIEGRADHNGEPQYNLQLSCKRARAVAEYLDIDELEYDGLLFAYGEKNRLESYYDIGLQRSVYVTYQTPKIPEKSITESSKNTASKKWAMALNLTAIAEYEGIPGAVIYGTIHNRKSGELRQIAIGLLGLGGWNAGGNAVPIDVTTSNNLSQMNFNTSLALTFEEFSNSFVSVEIGGVNAVAGVGFTRLTFNWLKVDDTGNTRLTLDFTGAQTNYNTPNVGLTSYIGYLHVFDE